MGIGCGGTWRERTRERRDDQGGPRQPGPPGSDRGDAESKKLDLTFGTSTADGRGNVTLSGSWTRQSSITQNDRGFSRTPLGEVNGQLVYSGSGSIPGTRVPLSAAQRAAQRVQPDRELGAPLVPDLRVFA